MKFYPLNLLPDDLIYTNVLAKYKTLIIKFICLIALAAILPWHLNLTYKAHRLEQELRGMKAKIDELTPLYNALMERETNDQFDLATNGHHKKWLALLTDINNSLPVDMWITDLHIKKHDTSDVDEGDSGNGAVEDTGASSKPADIILIKGRSRSAQSVGVFAHKLKDVTYLNNVDVDNITHNNAEDVLDYQIKAVFKEAP